MHKIFVVPIILLLLTTSPLWSNIDVETYFTIKITNDEHGSTLYHQLNPQHLNVQHYQATLQLIDDQHNSTLLNIRSHKQHPTLGHHPDYPQYKENLTLNLSTVITIELVDLIFTYDGLQQFPRYFNDIYLTYTPDTFMQLTAHTEPDYAQNSTFHAEFMITTQYHQPIAYTSIRSKVKDTIAYRYHNDQVFYHPTLFNPKAMLTQLSQAPDGYFIYLHHLTVHKTIIQDTHLL